MDESLIDPQFLARLQQLKIVSRKIFRGVLQGERRSKKKGSGVEFSDFRDYFPGDDLRYLDWNVYARLERLFLKLFVEEEEMTVALLLDASASMDFGSPTKLLVGKKIAVALGYLALMQQDMVSIGLIKDSLAGYLPPSRGHKQIFRIIDYLNTIKAESLTEIGVGIERFASRTTRKGVLFLISDFMTATSYEKEILSLAYRNWDVNLLQLLAEEEVNPVVKGDLRLVDSETGRTRDVTINRGVLKAYQSTLNKYCGYLEDFSTKHGFGYLRLTNTEDIEDIIFRFLRQKGMVRS